MVMNKHFFITLSTIAAFCSCSNEEEFGTANSAGEVSSPTIESKVFTATFEDDAVTRAVFAQGVSGSKDVHWQLDDIISINGLEYTAAPEPDPRTALFTKKDSLKPEPEAPFRAFHPVQISNYTLPSSCTYEHGRVDHLPMYAESNDETLQFRNICGVLGVKVTNDVMTKVKSIRVSSDYTMSGKFHVTSDYCLEFDTPAYKSLEMIPSQPVTIGSEGEIFYVPLMPRTYQNGIAITLTDINGTEKSGIIKAKSYFTVNRSKIYNTTFKVSGEGGLGYEDDNQNGEDR